MEGYVEVNYSLKEALRSILVDQRMKLDKQIPWFLSYEIGLAFQEGWMNYWHEELTWSLKFKYREKLGK